MQPARRIAEHFPDTVTTGERPPVDQEFRIVSEQLQAPVDVSGVER